MSPLSPLLSYDSPPGRAFGTHRAVERLRLRSRPMSTVFNLLIPIAIFATFAVLCFGIFAMFRGGNFGRSWSNKLMRLRVVTQFVAVLILLGALLVKQHMTGH